MPPPQDTQRESWDRFFGASANNRGWKLAEAFAAGSDPAGLLGYASRLRM